MVKSIEQAKRIGAKRTKLGKRGLSQAVKRFIKRTGISPDCSWLR